MIEPPTTWNSTSVSGPRPNCSRIFFGMVTCPRSPIFMLLQYDSAFIPQSTTAEALCAELPRVVVGVKVGQAHPLPGGHLAKVGVGLPLEVARDAATTCGSTK